MFEFTMPSLGADMEEGVLAAWYVQEGDPVERGQIIAAVDTDKAVIDVEVFHSGVVQRLLVEPGTSVPVGTPLAVIVDASDAAAPPEPVPEPVPEPASETEPEHVPVTGAARVHHASHVLSPLVRQLADRLHVDTTTITGTGHGGRVTRADVEQAGAAAPRTRETGSPVRGSRVRASPRARRLAEQRGVDLARISGSGPGGEIRERDVLAAPSPSSDATATPSEQKADRSTTMRRAIARAMERSNREIPHFHLTQLVDLAALRAHLDALNAPRPPAERLLPAAALLRATAMAAREVPELNGFWVDDELRKAENVNLAVAVNLRGGGLIAPVLHDADTMGLDELMGRMRDLVERARRGSLRGSEMQGATLTVTNLGDRGVDVVHGVIYPPQVALVGAGKIVDRPLVVDGEVVARPSVILTLAADHRAVDGQKGSRLLARIEAHLQEPEQL